MKSLIMPVILVILFIFSLNLADTEVCNPKGSLAAQINWANHSECK